MAARWSYSFQVSDPTGDRLREHAERSDGDRPCARDAWCASGSRERNEDGTVTRLPAMGYQAFCPRDRAIVGECLAELPATYARLALALGDHITAEAMIRVPFGPSVPLRTDVDEILRLIIDCAMAWHERVAAVARLYVPDTEDWHRRALGPYAPALLAFSAPVLLAHLDALLALAPEAMLRPCASPVTRTARVLSNGGDTALVEAGGADAGLEVLRLDYLARSAMLETRPSPERLLGVPCANCERRALQRAMPAQHDGDPDWYSACSFCGDLMDEPDYRQHCRRYAAFYRDRMTPAMVAS